MSGVQKSRVQKFIFLLEVKSPVFKCLVFKSAEFKNSFSTKSSKVRCSIVWSSKVQGSKIHSPIRVQKSGVQISGIQKCRVQMSGIQKFIFSLEVKSLRLNTPVVKNSLPYWSSKIRWSTVWVQK